MSKRALLPGPPAVRGIRPGRGPWQRVIGLLLLAGLSACAGPHRPYLPPLDQQHVRAYAPPGPPSDPWGPYIREASARFAVPEKWIREVMRQESGGQQYLNGSLTTSSAGAMGLMQVMPATYAELRQRYGLGPDPYHPRDNILAGAAYIRELADRFGSPGFLAAYNAGPRQLDDYLSAGIPLPAETVAYLAAVAPRLDSARSGFGPLALYPTGIPAETSSDELNRRALAGGLQPTTAVAESSAEALNRQSLAGAAAPVVAVALSAPAPMPLAGPVESPADELNRRSLAGAAAASSDEAAGWAVQIGAFSSPALAEAAAGNARALARGLLDAARTVVGATTRSDGVVLYRARLVGLAAAQASEACERLVRDRFACIVLPPSA